MNVRDRKGLKAEAAHQLSRASYDPRRLVLIHTGVSLGAGLLVAVINYILQQKIGAAGGLSGIGLRSVLKTVQSFLEIAVSLLTPFWAMGIIYGAIRLARGQNAEPKVLLAGFYRIGPVFRLKLLQGLIYSALMLPCVYVSIGIFSATPLSKEFMALNTSLWEGGGMIEPDPAVMDALLKAMFPVIPIFLAVYVIAMLPVFCRIRLAEYVILDKENCGARQALAASWRMTRGQGWALFKLDLSYWWFYGLHILAMILSYSDALLSVAGITLPVPEDALYFAAYILYVAVELALYWRFGAGIQTTYAVAYDVLREREEAMPSRIFPWEFAKDDPQEEEPWNTDQN